MSEERGRKSAEHSVTEEEKKENTLKNGALGFHILHRPLKLYFMLLPHCRFSEMSHTLAQFEEKDACRFKAFEFFPF